MGLLTSIRKTLVSEYHNRFLMLAQGKIGVDEFAKTEAETER